MGLCKQIHEGKKKKREKRKERSKFVLASLFILVGWKSLQQRGRMVDVREYSRRCLVSVNGKSSALELKRLFVPPWASRRISVSRFPRAK